MGYLDFDYDKRSLSLISKVLSRRGLAPDLDESWEIHGPHQGMDYQVYVGYAVPKDKKQKCKSSECNLLWSKCKKHINFHCVVIYPKAVYEIDEPSDWMNARTEDRIPVV